MGVEVCAHRLHTFVKAEPIEAGVRATSQEQKSRNRDGEGILVLPVRRDGWL